MTLVRQKIKRALMIMQNGYWESLNNAEAFLNQMKLYAGKTLGYLRACIDRNHEKSSWVNISGLAADALGFMAYRALSPIIAEYQNTEGIREVSGIIIGVIIAIGVWEFLSLTGLGWLWSLGSFLGNLKRKALDGLGRYFKCSCRLRKVCRFLYIVITIPIKVVIGLPMTIGDWTKRLIRKIARKYPWMIKAGIGLLAVVTVSIIVMIAQEAVAHFEKPEITYCKTIGEVYGIPTGVGGLLEAEELEECGAYWKIEDYPRRKQMVLTYMEPYQSLELLKQYTSLYGMMFFEPSARIVVEYSINEEKYRNGSQEIFAAARDNRFRELEQISYYNSSAELILQLEKKEYGKFDIVSYSSKEMPQLFNSTLLRIPDGQTVENDMVSQKIEVTYNTRGFPETRRLSPYIYNLYGVNGEYYEYDKHDWLSSLYYIDINGEFVCNKQGIMRIDFQYEDDGSLHSIRYYGDRDGTKKVEGFQGVFCEKFAYDSQGRLFERYQQNRNENLQCDENGVCIYRYHYEKNRLTEEEFLGFTGEPVRNIKFNDKHVMFDEKILEDGLREFTVATDVSQVPFGVMSNMTAGVEEQLDSLRLSGQSVLQEGYSQQVRQGTLQGGYSRQTGQSALQEGYGRQIDFPGQYDQQENESFYEQQYGQQEYRDILPGQYYDLEEESKVVKYRNNAWVNIEEEADVIHQYASVRYTIQPNGKVAFIKYYDNGNELMENEGGYAVKELIYDDKERFEGERYYDAGHNPCLIQDGYAGIEYSYDSERESEIECVTFLDTNGKKMFNQKAGYATVEYHRSPEDIGTKVQTAYFDQAGKPVRITGMGYVMAERYYNERNLLIWEAYYDESGNKMCRMDCGAAAVWYEYDDSGNLLREFYKDVDGHLINRTDTGYAAVYRRYEGGRLVHCHYGGYQDHMFGSIMDKTTGVSGIEYYYDGSRKIREEYYDAEGESVLRSDIGCAVQEFEYNDNGRVCSEYYYDTDGEPVLRTDTGYAVVKYQDNEDGQQNAVYFYGTDGELIVSARNQCAGVSYEYDAEHNCASVRYWGTDGELMIRSGHEYAQIVIDYDEYGNVRKVAYLDKQGQPVTRQDGGYAWYVNEYDNRKWIESRYYNESGRLTRRLDTGYAVIQNKYIQNDEQLFPGNSGDDERIVSQIFLDEEERPVISTKYQCAQILFTYDERGNRTDIRYLDEDGLLMVREDLGYAQIRTEYDDAGRCRSVLYYDAYGQPAICKEYCCAGFRYHYDDAGNQTEICYVGQEHELMIRPDLGYARICFVYDVLGNKVKESFWYADGKEALWKEGGFASREFVYENGCCVEERCFNEQGNLTPRKDNGCAIVRYQYDDQGRCISEMYYSNHEWPERNRQYHCDGRKFAYDEMGRLTDEWYIDRNGDLMLRSDLGYAWIHREYDGFGNQTVESYFDGNGETALWKAGGYASCIFVYDENGNCVEKRYLDAAGNSVLRSDLGYASIRFTYDDRGLCTAESYYGTKGQAVVNAVHGCFGREFAYDEPGNRTDTRYTGRDGRMMRSREMGYAHVHSEYDSWGNEIKVSYYDTAESPAAWGEGGYASYEQQYDAVGNCVMTRYFDEEGQPVSRRDEGYAAARYAYDDFGQCTAVSYYDRDECLVINTQYHCAGFQYQYDSRGNRTDIIYTGLDGQPMMREDLGYAWIHSEYDNLDNEIWKEYWNEDGQRVLCRQGSYACTEYVYDPITFYCYRVNYRDTEGELILRNDGGYCTVMYEYDGEGRRYLIQYCGTEVNQLVINSNYDCALLYYKYDEWGNNTHIWYYGEEEELREREDMGIVMNYMEYDSYGHLLSDEYYAFDPEDHTQVQLTLRKDQGYAVMEQEFEGANMTVKRFLDTEGNLIVPEKVGYAVCELEYNDGGQLVRWSYYDAKGNLTTPADEEAAVVERIYDEGGSFIGATFYDQYHVKQEERSWLSPTGHRVHPILDQWRQELYKVSIKEHF